MSALSSCSLRTETTFFNIRFENNPKGFYHPNETINGTVELHVEKTIKAAKGLKLIVTGVARCAWKKAKGKRTPTFEGTQTFLDYVIQFFDNRKNGTHVEVPIGVHLYVFQCKIPPNAVSSYEGTHGSVRYKISCILDSPAMPDVVYEVPVNVLRIESLNDFPWLRRGTDIEHEHQVGILCCETLPLLVSLKVERSGYAVGETIKILIEACNQGPAKFKNVIISLDRIEICNSQEPEKSFIKTRKIITFHATRNIREFESVRYAEMLVVPEDLAIVSSEKNCEVFQVAYQVKYAAKSNKRTRVEVLLPITIAHVPFSPDLIESSENKSECDLQSSPVEESQPVPRTPLIKRKSTKLITDIPAV